MTNAAVIDVPDAVIQDLVAFKTDAGKRAIQLTIEGEVLKTVKTVPVKGSTKDDFNALQDILDPKTPSFVLTRLEQSSAHPEYILVVFIPPACPVRPRTIFASGRMPVQRRLTQIFTGLGDYFIDAVKEVNYDVYCGVTKTDEGAMTWEELQIKRDNQEAVVGQVALPTHDSFTWPVDQPLKDLLSAFKSGGGPKFVAGKASDTGGAIAIAGTGEALEDIDGSGPRYIAIRYNDKGTTLKVFLLYCPDTAHARQKMMSSTCKQSFLKGCEEVGLEFERTYEVREKEGFTTANLDLLVNPPDVDHGYGEVKAFKKPARPGRK
jgi:twinfilin-like protein